MEARVRLVPEYEQGEATMALVKKVVFDEVQRFPTNSTMQNPACVKREKFRSEDGFHGGCGIARECG